MTTDTAGTGVRSDDDAPSWPEGPDRKYFGYVIIEWPAPRRKDGIPAPMPGWGCAILDAQTGEMIVTAEKIAVERVTADAESFITAELAMAADPDGNPVLFPGDDGRCPVYRDENGRIRTGVFPFIVTEMRVRS